MRKLRRHHGIARGQAGRLYPLFVVLGFTILITTFVPIGSYVAHFLGGMYGPVFGKGPPVLFHLFSLALNYAPLGVLITLLLRKYTVIDRVPRKYQSTVLFGLGTILILAYLAVRLLASTVAGGGASFVVASFSVFIVYPALLMLMIGAVKFLFGLSKNTEKLPP
ncbi:MAG: hypothetical protein V4631_11240 [Pseudomonadota bacterium]